MVNPMEAENLPNLGMIYDIPMKMSAQLRLVHQSTQEVLNFEAGSLVEMQQLASEPVNLCVNNVILARGEIVLNGDNLAIRITEMVPPGSKKS